MRTQANPIAHDVQGLMAHARQKLAERLNMLFKDTAVIEVIGEERAQRLAEWTASGGATLGRVSSEVRAAIVDQRAGHKLGQYGLWPVIDAIGHLGDCEPGRWPYFTDEKRRTSMQWAFEELDSLDEAMKLAKGQGSMVRVEVAAA